MIKYETLISNINPKRFFSSKSDKNKSSNKGGRRRRLTRSDDPSYSSSSSLSSSADDSSAHKGTGMATPQSVLPHSDDSSSDYTAALMLHAFKLIDRDGDGKISVAELELILNQVAGSGPPPTKEEVATMLTELDSDGDGCISLEEFGAIGSEAFCKPAGEYELRDAFDFFDVNRDGRITAEELLDGFIMLGDNKCTLRDCQKMIDEVDVNKDGYVCFQDFSRMMEQQQTPLA
uniref:EF-hand domain-containing protein n=1 Tax=Kalanchoe fedtschenkoi TaxID=63787 RepID=A0A7N0TVE0_KALFE